MFMNSDDMRVFEQAWRDLQLRAREENKPFTAQEIARRMFVVMAVEIYEPEELAKIVLADNFAQFEMDSCVNFAEPRLVEITRFIETASQRASANGR
jgi:hypothetical protein